MFFILAPFGIFKGAQNNNTNKKQNFVEGLREKTYSIIAKEAKCNSLLV